MTATVTARWRFIGHTTRFVTRTWPWRDVNVDVTMAATVTVVVGLFSDLHKRRSEWWWPRKRNLERGGILTLKGSNRRLGQEFSGIMMTRKKKEAIPTTRLNAYVSELNRPEIYNEKEVCNKLDTIMTKGKFCVWPIHRVFCRRRKRYRHRRRGFRNSVTRVLLVATLCWFVVAYSRSVEGIHVTINRQVESSIGSELICPFTYHSAQLVAWDVYFMLDPSFFCPSHVSKVGASFYVGAWRNPF